MWTFFRGWRRKAGTVVLLLALFFIGAWGRSQISNDRFNVPLGEKQIYRLAIRPEGVGFTIYERIGSQLYYLDNVLVPWSVTLPLALLAGWLILWRPRHTGLPEERSRENSGGEVSSKPDSK